MSINTLLSPSGDDIYYDEGFRIVLDSFIHKLRNSESTNVVTITPQQAYMYEGDFYGLLDEIGIPKKYHYFVMRINNYSCSGDFVPTTQTFLLPAYEEIDEIKIIYNTRKSKIY